ncbi:low molecular weight phosphotyrosine protein phosphatase 1 isoform X2 [Drosophila virilis]|uniref:low molecular weight phosphotyrosine protein phosphatase 1 isoform X2 n=1 Tax=Drosophila virilis TaxID=7244 RepID=UPI0013964E22|nr:low molecular weight phosphotyrosine protein phosphatase 1 isoform X2 [Drosophila virilis]
MTFKKLLFVCMGNSCSSPMAETIMQNLMVKTSLYWEVDSAALRTWNIGRRPHKRCLRVLREHGLRSDHFCRLLTVQDFYYFDYIITMNEHIYKELLLWADANHISNTSNVLMLGSYGKNGKTVSVIDLSPARKLKAFRNAYYQIKECCKQLILGEQVYETINPHRDSSESPDSMNADGQQYPSKSSLIEPCSVCSISAPMSNKKKLCQKCGQKFLAKL